MTTHGTGTREEWMAARLELLVAEKELTRRSDELARRRQQLPWVRIDKGYRFATDEGSASLPDLFRGGSQRGTGGPERGHDRSRSGHVHTREAGHERLRARGRRRPPYLFHLCTRTGRPLGRVPVARPRPQGTQRDGRLVAPSRRVRRS